MKKLISVLLTCILLISCLTVPVGAQTANEKIDPTVMEAIAAAQDEGMVVRITYHNDNYPTEGLGEQELVANTLAAQRELRESIEAITYCEPSNLIYYNGTMLMGLPYSSIEAVAALPNVDYIDLPEEGSYVPAEQKISDNSKEKLAALEDDNEVQLFIWLAYNTNVYIGMKEPDEDTVTSEQMDAYREQRLARMRAYISAKNAEFAQRIADAVEVDDIETMNLVPIIYIRTTADKVMDIAALPEVWTVDVGDSQDPFAPMTEPDTETVSEKFERFMWDTQRAVREDDSGETVPDQDVYYCDYEELYSCDDWTLIRAHTRGIVEPWLFVGSIDFGGRILSWWMPGAGIYPFGLFIYDAAQDAFITIDQVDPDDYAGILDVLEELKIGRPLGDADGDNELTILDATAIQRDLADIEALPENDYYALLTDSSVMAEYRLYSDADRDGETTIMDATRIQRTVADLSD